MALSELDVIAIMKLEQMQGRIRDHIGGYCRRSSHDLGQSIR